MKRLFNASSLLVASLLFTGCGTPTNQDACAQTYEGHERCAEANGAMYFCGDEGRCIEASGCEALSCCVPGRGGDAWCVSQFGQGSQCAVADNDGGCTRSPNPGACEQTYEGHQACVEANDAMHFCSDEGHCIEASGCEALSCCVPGQGGDAWCVSQFGQGSECAVTDNDGRCT